MMKELDGVGEKRMSKRSAGRQAVAVIVGYPWKISAVEPVNSRQDICIKAAARTVETVCAAIGNLLGAFTASECASYFKNSGYAPN